MKAILLVLSLAALGCGARVRGEAAFNVSYVIAGGAAHRGGKAPATGGAAIMPAARLLLESEHVDPYITVAPAFVSPQTLNALGFVGALDAGASWHPRTRGWHVGTAATLAPTYMRFCNASWCLKEWVALYGAEVHFGGHVVRTEGGGRLSASLALRVLTGRPTAWYWPHLSPNEADVNHWIAAAGGYATWRF